MCSWMVPNDCFLCKSIVLTQHHINVGSLMCSLLYCFICTYILHRTMLLLSLCVSPFVCHKPVLYRNNWTNRTGIWLGGSLPLRKFGYLWNFVPNFGLRKFRHGESIALSTACHHRRRSSSSLLTTPIRQSTSCGCLLQVDQL